MSKCVTVANIYPKPMSSSDQSIYCLELGVKTEWQENPELLRETALSKPFVHPLSHRGLRDLVQEAEKDSEEGQEEAPWDAAALCLIILTQGHAGLDWIHGLVQNWAQADAWSIHTVF